MTNSAAASSRVPPFSFKPMEQQMTMETFWTVTPYFKPQRGAVGPFKTSEAAKEFVRLRHLRGHARVLKHRVTAEQYDALLHQQRVTAEQCEALKCNPPDGSLIAPGWA
jgi:hypothetical protein